MTYVLTSDASPDVASSTGSAPPRWQDRVMNESIRRCLILVAGEVLSTPELDFPDKDQELFILIGAGLDAISDDGLELRVSFGDKDSPDGRQTLLTMPIPAADYPNDCIPVRLGLPMLAGRRGSLCIECLPGPKGNPLADWLALAECVVSPCDSMGLHRATANKNFRIENEIRHFEHVYSHPIYAQRRKGEQGAASSTPLEQAGGSRRVFSLPSVGSLLGQPALRPKEGEEPYGYAHRLLDVMMEKQGCNFPTRLKAIASRHSDRKLRILSILCGTASIEAALVARSGIAAEVTLIDLNEKLLAQTENIFPDNCTVQRFVGDINMLEKLPERYDVVCCVSGLHHVVELEMLFEGINGCLEDDGEFFVMGEQVGRNGNMLWPGDHAVAQAAFSGLPDPLRLNANTGRTDRLLPNRDCASGTFEGIRSSEIIHTLQKYFHIESQYLRNCFLWILLNQTYWSNYNMRDESHVKHIVGLVLAECRHAMNGGTPTAMDAVLKPKRFFQI